MTTATISATISDASAQATSDAAELLLGVRDKDPAAWDEVVRRYGRLVAMTVRSFRLQETDALDAVQMTWLRLAENAHRVKFPEKLGGWLATTARHECMHILRQAKSSPGLIEVAPETVADPSMCPEQRVINAETARTLHKLVAELPPRRRRLLRALFSGDPLPYAEVARTAGIPPGAIGPTRARALQQLRDKLTKYERGIREHGPRRSMPAHPLTAVPPAGAPSSAPRPVVD